MRENAGRRLQVTGHLIARNTVINLAGYGLPFVMAVITMPFVVRGLGTERFGVLALAWVVLGYLNSVFDLGFSRAVTKLVAEAGGRGDEARISALITTATISQAILGVLVGAALAALAPVLVHRVLSVPGTLLGEAEVAFFLLAVSVPLVMVSTCLCGCLEAVQRFDLAAVGRAPFSALMYLLPAVAVLVGWTLPGTLLLIVISRVLALVVHVGLCAHVFPSLRGFPRFSKARFRALLAFGGWVTASNVTISGLVYLDRFLIGSLAGMRAVAYYAAPYEIASRLLVVPGSLAGVLVPAFSGFAAAGALREIGTSFARSIRYVLLVMTPGAFLLLVFAADILRIWLGSEFAAAGAGAFRLLALAVLMNGVGWMPAALLEGIGRPDITAKYHLVEFPVYAAVAYTLIAQFGIEGAALAWCLRTAVSIPVFALVGMRTAGLTLRALFEVGMTATVAITAGLLGAAKVVGLWPGGRGPMSAAILAAYAAVVWLSVLDQQERSAVLRVAGQLTWGKRMGGA